MQVGHLIIQPLNGETINMKWNTKLPEKSGNYLCKTNDNLVMVCFLSVNGFWSKVPDAKFYGDMGTCVKDSKKVDRKVVSWVEIPDDYDQN